MYKDLSGDNIYPKTLIIRNHEGGMIWQVYHVQKQSEAEKISANAHRNGFDAITLVDHEPETKETWPDWRETCTPDILE